MHTWGQGKLFTKKMNLQGELSVVFPKFRREKCIGCGRCAISCADGGHQAIRLSDDRKPILDGKKCVGCHLCVLVCPERAVVSSHRRISRA